MKVTKLVRTYTKLTVQVWNKKELSTSKRPLVSVGLSAPQVLYLYLAFIPITEPSYTCLSPKVGIVALNTHFAYRSVYCTM